MDNISRLERSSNAMATNRATLIQEAERLAIPYSTNPRTNILPTADLQDGFTSFYNPAPLPPLNLSTSGQSTIMVLEPKMEYVADGAESFHGEVVAAVAEQVGKKLAPHVEVLYVKANISDDYRSKHQNGLLDSVKTLIENPGVPVIVNSTEWRDEDLCSDASLAGKIQHPWNISAFVVDSAGNKGKGSTQKHSVILHGAPLAVHVGAAAFDKKAGWHIEDYSADNSPTFLAPVAPDVQVIWRQKGKPESVIGTSVAAPYAGGVFGALNDHFGAYLTREQILYAVIATCLPISQVGIATPKSAAETITYTKNAVGFAYNAGRGGFGLIQPHKANRILEQMVALTKRNPDLITIPTEEQVYLNVRQTKNSKPQQDGLYHYKIKMPPGYALKTTIDVDFDGAYGDIKIRSPSGTKFPMVLSRSYDATSNFSLSTSHAWAGEKLEGFWEITSTEPVKCLRMNQHHFLSGDVIHGLDIPTLLAQKERPDVYGAVPLHELGPQHSISQIFRQAQAISLTNDDNHLVETPEQDSEEDIDEISAEESYGRIRTPRPPQTRHDQIMAAAL